MRQLPCCQEFRKFRLLHDESIRLPGRLPQKEEYEVFDTVIFFEALQQNLQQVAYCLCSSQKLLRFQARVHKPILLKARSVLRLPSQTLKSGLKVRHCSFFRPKNQQALPQDNRSKNPHLQEFLSAKNKNWQLKQKLCKQGQVFFSSYFLFTFRI